MYFSHKFSNSSFDAVISSNEFKPLDWLLQLAKLLAICGINNAGHNNNHLQ